MPAQVAAYRAAQDRSQSQGEDSAQDGGSAGFDEAEARIRMDAIDGEALLEQAARIHTHALSLLASLEQSLGQVGSQVKPSDVVHALREVRASLETLGKFFVMVEDRPKRTEASERPEIDAAILKALQERDIVVAPPARDESHWAQYREPAELPAVSGLGT